MPQAEKWMRLGGRIQYHLDGSITYIKNGVSVVYNKLGFPDFSKYLYTGKDGLNQVRITLTGNRAKDELAANLAAGFKNGTPDYFTWHHNEDLGLMQLVDEAIHRSFWHRGGFSLSK